MEFDATFIIAVISFIVFVFVMNKIFYAPVLRIMQERQNFVDDNYTKAKQTAEEVSAQTQIHNNQLEQTRDEARVKVASESKRIKQESAKAVLEYKSELYQQVSQEKDNLRNSAIEAKEILRMKNMLNQLLAEHTGQKLETIKKDTERDNFMTAQQALEYGLIDKIITKD